MRNSKMYLLIGIALMIGACGTGKNSNTTKSTNTITDGMTADNRMNTSLLDQISRLRGVTLRGGVPVFSKGTNSVSGSVEPLYVVNGYTVGNSFSSVIDLVNPVDVESIKAVDGSAASFYGSRGANGVIVIKTKS